LVTPQLSAAPLGSQLVRGVIVLKKIFYAILFLNMFSTFAISQVVFEHLSFNQALLKAKKNNKTLFVYFYTDWCAPCKQLDTIVFADPKIRTLLNDHYINLKLNAEKGEGIALNKKYNSDGYPTFVFIATTGKLLGEIHGTRSNESYLIAMKSNVHNDPEGKQWKKSLKKDTEKKK